MDNKTLIESIKSKWLENDLKGNLVELKKAILGGSTGSEINVRIAVYLCMLKKENSIAYNVAKNDIDNFLNINRQKEDCDVKKRGNVRATEIDRQ